METAHTPNILSSVREAGSLRQRILFVDDEPSISQGLQRLLFPLRQEWDMVFVGSGDEIRFGGLPGGPIPVY